MDWCFRDGWATSARRVPSPHYDKRPNEVLTLVVVHAISLPPGAFDVAAVDALFLNQLDPNADPYFAQILPLRVSAHFLIDRVGALTQYVACQDRAWHAGKSEWQGRPACNDYSIGIELLGSDDQVFTEAQYQSLSDLLLSLFRTYPTLSRHTIVGHSDIAPGRKTDPGPCFQWEHLHRLLQEKGATT
ncbi:MAG: 1,6-anhydro-N-acetylmuramyl-L-alanine amidase AmpD [Pseudomonadota bacterium]